MCIYWCIYWTANEIVLLLSIVFDSVPVNQKKTGTEQSVFSADIEQMALLSQNKCTELFSLASIVLQNKCTELLNELISLGDIVLQNEFAMLFYSSAATVSQNIFVELFIAQHLSCHYIMVCDFDTFQLLCCSLKICLLDGHSQRAVLALHLV